jgi:hypothetical protein
VALPITTAAITVGDFRDSKAVAKGDTAVRFTTTLKAGKTTLRTAFAGADGKNICGAYFVTVR